MLATMVSANDKEMEKEEKEEKEAEEVPRWMKCPDKFAKYACG